MFCPKCGKEFNEGRFCGACGACLVSDSQAVFQNVIEPEQKNKIKLGTVKSKRKKKVVIAISSLTIIVVAVFCIYKYHNRIELPYRWGTSLETLNKEEPSLRDCGLNGVVYGVKDEDHKTDRIKEFLIDYSEVYYYFHTDDDTLSGISYGFRMEGIHPAEEDSFSEAVRIISEYYGDDYYELNSGSSASHGTKTAFWWVGDTVVELSWREDGNRYFLPYLEISYLSAEYVRDSVDFVFEDVTKYFGKRPIWDIIND